MLRRVASTIAFAAVLSVLPACSSGGGGYRVTAYFPKAVALYRRSDVKILGLSAGKVNEIKVVGAQVRVRMTIDRDVKLPVDVSAAIVPFSLIGERYVQLFPAWTEGRPAAPAGTVIPGERTVIPTEPDEALAALKKFLDALDPHATGRLVRNLGEDLKGNGQELNGALAGLAQLTVTLADKDRQLIDIVDHFDRLTATLRTREGQLGKVMDEFAVTTHLLADERRSIESLVRSLASVSSDGLDLVSRHQVGLDADLTTLTRLLQSVHVHLDDVDKLLVATPYLALGPQLDGKKGLAGAWDPKFHHIDLRNSYSPTASQAADLFGVPGNVVCLPQDVGCVPSTAPVSARRGPVGWLRSVARAVSGAAW